MMKGTMLLVMMALIGTIKAQTDSNSYLNTADRLLSKNSKLTIGGYGEVHCNQPINSEVRQNGTLDVHRFVLLFG